MRRQRFVSLTLALLALAAACHGDDVTGITTTGIELASGRTLTDTITAQPSVPLLVVVRGTDGSPISGTPVRFETSSLNEPIRIGPWAVLCAEGTAVCGNVGATNVNGATTLAATTNAQGEARAVVRLGTFAGNTFLRVTAPAQGMMDSIALDIRTGAPARINFAARDTTVTIGATTTAAAFAADRFYNPRSDLVALAAPCVGIADLDPVAKHVTARAFGVCWVRATVGGVVDSARVVIVPAGRLLTWSTVPVLQLVNTDGTTPRRLFGGASFRSDLGAFPRFNPSRGGITLHTAAGLTGQPITIARGDTAAGTATTLGTTVADPAYARELADGTVLFVGRTTGEETHAVWRLGASGAPAVVRAITDYANTYAAVDISPDGSRIVYVGGVIGGPNVLRIMNLATGAITELGAVGEAPRWSPDGDRIAYLHGVSAQNVRGGLSEIRVADRASRVITERQLLPGFAWSPDGAYVVAGTDAGAVIVRVADGVVVPMRVLSSPFAREFDWR